METTDYIDWDEGRDFEDASSSVAVLECENCGKACEELFDLPSWNFKACETCMEDCAREDAREAAELAKARTQTALPFAPKPCVHCKTRISPLGFDLLQRFLQGQVSYFLGGCVMTKREIEIYLERINERMVRAYGRELQPLEREAIRRALAKKESK